MSEPCAGAVPRLAVAKAAVFRLPEADWLPAAVTLDASGELPIAATLFVLPSVAVAPALSACCNWKPPTVSFTVVTLTDGEATPGLGSRPPIWLTAAEPFWLVTLTTVIPVPVDVEPSVLAWSLTPELTWLVTVCAKPGVARMSAMPVAPTSWTYLCSFIIPVS